MDELGYDGMIGFRLGLRASGRSLWGVLRTRGITRPRFMGFVLFRSMRIITPSFFRWFLHGMNFQFVSGHFLLVIHGIIGLSCYFFLSAT